MLDKWPFLDQNHGLTPWKNVNFSTFCTSCFYSLERRFSTLEYRKRHFSLLYFLKKKNFEKWPFLDQNHELTVWGNVNFSTYGISCFNSLERRIFALKYRKRDIPGPNCPQKKFSKNDHFWTKTMG